jgi:hypothetical protein
MWEATNVMLSVIYVMTGGGVLQWLPRDHSVNTEQCGSEVRSQPSSDG